MFNWSKRVIYRREAHTGVLAPLIAKSAHIVMKNKTAIIVTTTAIVETLSVITTGEINPPEAPKSLETMLESPMLEKASVEEITSIAENGIRGKKDNHFGSQEKMLSKKPRVRFELLELLEVAEAEPTAENIYGKHKMDTTIFLQENGEPRDDMATAINGMFSELEKISAQKTLNENEARTLIVNVNTIMCLAAMHKFASMTEANREVLINTLAALTNYYVDDAPYIVWEKDTEKMLGINPDNVTQVIDAQKNYALATEFQHIHERHKDYFERMRQRQNNLPTLNNETTNALELKREAEKAQERLALEIQNYEKNCLLKKIELLKNEVNTDITNETNSIIARSKLMAKDIQERIIPNLEKLEENVASKLKSFKRWVMMNKILAYSATVTSAISVGYYCYHYGNLGMFTKAVKTMMWGTAQVTKKTVEKTVAAGSKEEIEQEVLRLLKEAGTKITPKQASVASATAALVSAGLLKKIIAGIKK